MKPLGFRYKILDRETAYTGKELRSGWVENRSGYSGDAAVGFIGPCRVANEDLVDLDDAGAGESITAASMAHVIVEHPQCDLETAVHRQRLLVCVLCEMLVDRNLLVRRSGDDVFVDSRKLTVSIAAPGPASALIHLGINVDPHGAPVAAVGLGELGIDPAELLQGLLERYRREVESIRYATGKVRRVP